MSEAKISSRNKNRDSVNFATVYRLLWTFGVYIIRRKYASRVKHVYERSQICLTFIFFNQDPQLATSGEQIIHLNVLKTIRRKIFVPRALLIL